MAHGDYNCCAICDCKLEYSHVAMTKERICESCLKCLRKLNIPIITVEELKEYILKQSHSDLITFLEKIDFTRCYYMNDVDELLKSKGVTFDDSRRPLRRQKEEPKNENKEIIFF